MREREEPCEEDYEEMMEQAKLATHTGLVVGACSAWVLTDFLTGTTSWRSLTSGTVPLIFILIVRHQSKEQRRASSSPGNLLKVSRGYDDDEAESRNTSWGHTRGNKGRQ